MASVEMQAQSTGLKDLIDAVPASAAMSDAIVAQNRRKYGQRGPPEHQAGEVRSSAIRPGFHFSRQ